MKEKLLTEEYNSILNEKQQKFDIEVYALIGMIEYHDVMTNIEYLISDYEYLPDFRRNYEKDPYATVKKFLKDFNITAKDCYDTMKENDILF